MNTARLAIRGRDRRRHLFAAGIVILLSSLPVQATASPADASACTISPTDGVEPRHPYLGRDAADALATNPAFAYGQNPYVYTIYAPESLTDEAPLLLALHGFVGSAEASASSTEFTDLADDAGLVVAFASGARSWDYDENGHDLQYLRDVVADIRAERCIDARRIWVVGHSSGGTMSQRLACDASDVFAAAVVYAAGEVEQVPFGGYCDAGLDAGSAFEPAPIAFWHGTADNTVAYETGRLALQNWTRIYGCDTAPLAVQPSSIGSLERYGNCNRADVLDRERATGQPFEVLHQTIEGHGHGWPDGCGGTPFYGVPPECPEPEAQFPTAQEMNQQILAFLQRHPRSTPAPELPAPDISRWLDEADPVRQVSWLSELGAWTWAPSAGLRFVDEVGAAVPAPRALADTNVYVELVIQKPANHPDGALDEHPICPSTSPGSGKLRYVGRDVTLRLADDRGTFEQVATTQEQTGTGLAVAKFTLERLPQGAVVVEVTTGSDPVATPAACTVRDARFQQTLRMEVSDGTRRGTSTNSAARTAGETEAKDSRGLPRVAAPDQRRDAPISPSVGATPAPVTEGPAGPETQPAATEATAAVREPMSRAIIPFAILAIIVAWIARSRSAIRNMSQHPLAVGDRTSRGQLAPTDTILASGPEGAGVKASTESNA